MLVHFKWLLTRLFAQSRSCTSRAKTLPGDRQDGLENLGEDHDELLSPTPGTNEGDVKFSARELGIIAKRVGREMARNGMISSE
jgi:hypothetical protein